MDEKLALTMQDVLEAYGALSELVSRYKSELPVAASLRVARLTRQLRAEVGVYRAERDRLVQLHGAEDEEGKITVQAGTAAHLAFAADERELLAQEIRLPIEPLGLEELGLERIDADVVVGLMPVLGE